MLESKEMLKKMEAFYEAASELLDTWSDVSDSDFDTLCDDYPFEQSFDEVVASILWWIDIAKQGEKNAH